MDDIYLFTLPLFLIGIILFTFKNQIKRHFGSHEKSISPSDYYKQVENGYKVLITLLYHGCDEKRLRDRITTIMGNRKDGRYLGGYTRRTKKFDFISFSLDTFYDFLRYKKPEEEHLIFDLHKNVTLDKLNEFIELSLNNTVDTKSFLLTNKNQFSYPYDNILSIYQDALEKKAIKIGFFTDNSDSYYLFLFPSSKEIRIKYAIEKIGFEYKTIQNSKVKEEIEYKTPTYNYHTGRQKAFS